MVAVVVQVAVIAIEALVVAVVAMVSTIVPSMRTPGGSRIALTSANQRVKNSFHPCIKNRQSNRHIA